MKLLKIFLLLALSWTLACGSDASSPNLTENSQIEWQEFLNFKAALCEKIKDCSLEDCSVIQDYYIDDELGLGVENQLTLTEIEAAIQAGEIVFNQNFLSTCLTSIEEASCAPNFAEYDPEDPDLPEYAVENLVPDCGNDQINPLLSWTDTL